MRVIVQRVSEASVQIDQKIQGSIQKGFVLLVGIEEDDTFEDCEWLASKISQMRVFSDDIGKMNLSIQEIKGSLLIISQFTLFASTKKGNRPSFIKAARPETAIPLYTHFIDSFKAFQIPTQTGVFGADMKISLINDGPVTIFLDSKNKE
jgi:D-tyrosyl-tRNA(Tyr) deacylase